MIFFLRMDTDVSIDVMIALGSVLLGAGLMAGGVLLGGLMVFRTKAPHQPFLGGPVEGDSYVSDPDLIYSEDADPFAGRDKLTPSEKAAKRAAAQTFGDLDEGAI